MSAAFFTFSKKQMLALTWWCPGSAHSGRDGVICDGAVRSGKTLCMAISFVAWAFYAFDGGSFALCGKTIASLRRNLTVPILPVLKQLGFEYTEKRSENLIVISREGRTNRFYLFGGKDEGSAALIQGMTLGGVLLDEAALMPRSFVEQALARCSREGSKLFFNCNPETPMHWFYEEWIKKTKEKNCLYIHFTMRDNPSLNENIIARYEKLYSGAFYDRFVLGKWTATEGCVYPMFNSQMHVREPPPYRAERYVISCDYGTVNPSSFGLWGNYSGCWHRIAEYYYDSRLEGEQKTDDEYSRALEALAADYPVEAVVVDPSAASFITCLHRGGKFKVIPAKNEVLDGIRLVSCALKDGRLLISPECKDAIREFALYRWEENTRKDSPRKENDHAMDDIRYLFSTLEGEADPGFCVMAAPRR